MRKLLLLLPLAGAVIGCSQSPTAIKVYCESPSGIIVATNPADTLKGCYQVATP